MKLRRQLPLTLQLCGQTVYDVAIKYLWLTTAVLLYTRSKQSIIVILSLVWLNYMLYYKIIQGFFLLLTLLTASTKTSLSPSPLLAEHSTNLAAFIFLLNFFPSAVEIVSMSSARKSVFVAVQ